MCRKGARIRYFQCPVCGVVLTAPKHNGITHSGHVKTMYCYICGKNQDFVQIDSERVRQW